MPSTVTETIGSFRRNLALDSEAFDGTAWTQSNCTVTPNAATASDGTVTADLLTDTAGPLGTDSQLIANSLLSDGELYTARVELKANDASQSAIRIEIENGSVFTDFRVDWSGGVPSISGDTSTGGGGAHPYCLRPIAGTTGAGWYILEAGITYDDTDGGGNEDIKVYVGPSTAAGTSDSTYAARFQVDEGVSTPYQAQGSSDGWTGDYATIASWETAHSDPVGDDTVYVGELLDGAFEVDAASGGGIAFDAAVGNTDATRYRMLTYATTRYTPHDHTGPRVYVKWDPNVNGAQEGLVIGEDYFRIEGVAVIGEDPYSADAVGGVNRPVIHVDADAFRANAVFVRCSESYEAFGTNAFLLCWLIEGDDAQFFNCVSMGGTDGRGAYCGWLFDSSATDGGVYNCVAWRMDGGSIPRGFFGNANPSFKPEIINCTAIDCHRGSGADIAGLWSRYGYNITSDVSAVTGFSGGTSYGKDADGNETTQTSAGLPDEWSWPYTGAESVLGRAASQEFRPVRGSNAHVAGRDESSTFTSGIGKVEDWDANSRANLPNWSISPWFVFAPTIGNVEELVEQIGSAAEGRHYGTVEAWIAATEGLSFRSRNERRVGVLNRDDASVWDVGASTVHFRRSVADRGRYRQLKVAAGWRWDPAEGVGAKIHGTAEISGNPVVLVAEDYFRMQGFAIEQDNVASSTYQVVRVVGDYVVLDSMALRYDSGSAGSNIDVCLQVRGHRFLGTNLIAIGSGTTAGAAYGFWCVDGTRCKLYHCIAFEIGDGPGYGFRQDANALRCEWSGCISMDCTVDFSHETAADGPVTQDHNISSDTTADGPGSLVSQSAASVWNSSSTEDFRLLATSPAIKAGRNLSPFFSSDFAGGQRLAPFDIGPFEGIGVTVYGAPVDLRKDALYLAELIEIRRQDGVGFFFTDANEPIVHGGRTYVPQDGVNQSAQRGEAGLGESSSEYHGIVSDSSITAADLLAGLFRGAVIIARLVDWRVPWRLPIRTRHRFLGPGEFDGETWRGDVVGLAHLLSAPSGRVQGPTCPYRLGDEECQKDITSETYDDVRIASVTDARREFNANTSDIPVGKADGWFENGELVWLSGDNVGTLVHVKTYTSAARTIVLVERMGKDIQASDTFQIKVGCRKRYQEDCIDKHANGPNFGADPFSPGTDSALDTLSR